MTDRIHQFLADRRPETPCLVIDLAVIEDPIRTDPQEGQSAVWTFKHLMEQMAGDTAPSDFVMNWLLTWTVDQDINGSQAPARPQIWDQVITPWLAASGGRRERSRVLLVPCCFIGG